jgi:hypothetical protein
MAFKILVTDSLTDAMIEAGEKLTRFLDSVGFPVSASFWLYLPELKVWRLTIASPLVSQYGPKEAYKKIHQAILSAPADLPIIPTEHIRLVPREHPLVSLLRKVVTTGKSLSGVRFSENVINGVLIPDAYLYRVT